ncbi:hypothetical protein ACFOUP_10620 [Belliella kenyensis]|uniref:4Fe4S-binding SPASM domain-containing protein n=1 Tax=Belliella kenyensis TaxID=1472724 RepID=A0ABV8ELR7_9BACT|nr:hypothetical protein [Belliella kenyensis]MCH7400477.1 hypothetical protein [Belliella kenyensis]MDN3604507.1 hypothetical protein [Belliella kenyensis]
MKFFYLSSISDENGNFQIHEKECPFLPDALDRDYLGPFNNGKEALRRALSINKKATICEHCCEKKIAKSLLSQKEN